MPFPSETQHLSTTVDLDPRTGWAVARLSGSPLELRRESKQRYWLHALLFVATVCSTLIVGAELQSSFLANQPPFSADETLFRLGWILSQPSRLLLGVPFSLSLMLILVAHEMGHYLAARYYRIEASLPYFLPAPTLIGTFGAFIRIRSPIYSRRALFDIGIAGPIAGFLFSVGALAIGMKLSRFASGLVRAADLQLGYPLIFQVFKNLVPGATGASMPSLCLHPIAIAAWVGMFATALNLLPGGQLDGGHILYAIWPGAHKKISRLLVVALIIIGLAWWPGWLLWAAILLSFGRSHPNVPRFPALDMKRRGLGVCAALMFLLSFTPAPILGLAIAPISIPKMLLSLAHSIMHRF